MNGILIKDKDEIITISCPQRYEAQFKLSVLRQTDNEWVVSNLDMNEVLEPFDNLSTTIVGDFLKGVDSIEVSDSTGIVVADKLKLLNFVYDVKNIDGNFITITNLKEDIVDGTSLDRSGASGLYQVTVNLDTVANYVFTAKDSKFGLQVTDSIKVEPRSVEQMYKDIKNLEYAILGS